MKLKTLAAALAIGAGRARGTVSEAEEKVLVRSSTPSIASMRAQAATPRAMVVTSASGATGSSRCGMSPPGAPTSMMLSDS